MIELVVPPLRERRDEIPTLTESFIARYSRKYKRPSPRLSPKLRQLFNEYDWPGNIRELENTIKRLVILQDEQIAFAEIERSSRRVAAGPAPAAPEPAPVAASPDTPTALESAGPRSESISDVAETDADSLEAPEPENGNGGSLAAVARAASMKAERALIEKTLNQVHWNRRKASQILGVSYKTLLNKIKECSITRD